MELLVALVLIGLIGLVIGGLARLAVPGPDPMSIWKTIALGVVGAFVGGLLARAAGLEAGGFLFAVAGAVGVLIAYRILVQRRPITGPGAKLPPS